MACNSVYSTKHIFWLTSDEYYTLNPLFEEVQDIKKFVVNIRFEVV